MGQCPYWVPPRLLCPHTKSTVLRHTTLLSLKKLTHSVEESPAEPFVSSCPQKDKKDLRDIMGSVETELCRETVIVQVYIVDCTEHQEI